MKPFITHMFNILFCHGIRSELYLVSPMMAVSLGQ